jgi:hypothetical protein
MVHRKEMMMLVRTILEDKAFGELVEFCRQHLKPDLDPVQYATALDNAANVGNIGDTVTYEISSYDARSRHVESISFWLEEDFRHAMED